MSEEDNQEKPPPSAPPPNAAHSPRWISWPEVRQRFKDLVVVFFGVYAAFVLNRFEADRRDSLRRRQLLVVLEHETAVGLGELKAEVSRGQIAVEDFDRRLTAGEMPPLRAPQGNIPYNAVNDVALFQIGDSELLDVETLDQLRKVDRLQRALTQASHNGFEFGLTLLEPHEDRDIYDPATRQLRPRFAWYPVILHTLLNRAQELLAGEERLLALIQARRQS